ncbi:MAG TPA: hypothetical protein VFH80_31025 [Solirubrobacteraceae bacterium]|nr:hypothetical protein [Solirubrobacteraceae bacterium]
MSYDLCFWSERPGAGLAPQTVYEKLLAGGDVDGLLQLPIDAYLEALAKAFPGGRREPNGAGEWFVWEGSDSMFEVWWSAVHVLVIMRPLDEDSANRLIDLAALFGAPLYDPQTGERFALSG